MYKKVFKRLLDIVLALIALFLLVLIFVPVAIAIKFEDGGPIFYNAKRLGRYQKEFNMYKFRSMKVNAPDIRNKDGSTYNSDDDPRVTNIGRFIRKTSIDELPQLLNVLIGNMSFVGPRPSPLGNTYDEIFIRKFEVKPGITGYNQAKLRNSATHEERVKNDIYYVDNISFGLDVKILFWTFIGVVQRKNINGK